jgi:hypothetical protein
VGEPAEVRVISLDGMYLIIILSASFAYCEGGKFCIWLR